MSVNSIATDAVARYRGDRASDLTPGVMRETPGAQPAGAGPATDAVSELTRHLPTELVAAYTAVVGLLPAADASRVCDADFTARWVAFAVFAALTPLAILVAYRAKRRAAGGSGPGVPLFELVIASAAYIAWAVALPLAPIWSWCEWNPQYGVALAVTALFVIGLAIRARPAA